VSEYVFSLHCPKLWCQFHLLFVALENVNLELGMAVFINWIHFKIGVSLILSLLPSNFLDHTVCYALKVKLSSIQQQSILYLHKSKKFPSTPEIITIFVSSGPKPDESSVLYATYSHAMFNFWHRSFTFNSNKSPT
jgi:hypothetical protein